eukprot:3879659-Amphidinium_carterae.1
MIPGFCNSRVLAFLSICALEDHLTMLQGCADEFRSMVVQPPVQSPSGLENSEQKEPWVVLEDLSAL